MVASQVRLSIMRANARSGSWNNIRRSWFYDYLYYNKDGLAWTLEGWLYLAIVMDQFSWQIVGNAMDKRMKRQHALDALAMGYFRRKPSQGLLHHSDRGS